MLEIIQVNINNMINEINKSVGQNPSKIKHSKFISISVNNRSGYFKQLTTILKII